MTRRACRMMVMLALANLTVGCATTITGIRRLGTEGNIPALVEKLSDPKSWVREESARVLGKIKAAQAARPLEARLTDATERSYVRAAAADALGKIRDPGSLLVLAGDLAAPGTPPDVKIALIEAVCAFGPAPEALQAIAPLSSDEDLLVSALAESRSRSRCGH